MAKGYKKDKAFQGEELTDNEELALALVLWKCWRSRSRRSTKDGSYKLTEDNEAVSNKALELACKFGIKDEFFKILFEVPLLRITCMELDEWIGVRPCVGSPTNSSETSNIPKRQPPGKRKR